MGRRFSSADLEDFGIELLWQEVVALKHYTNRSYELFMEGNLVDSISQTGLQLFLLDYFGLKHRYLEGHNYRKKTCFGRRDGGGLDLLGTQEFKEYCRRKVAIWREERTLP
jgi:hypothetical protein